MEDVVSLDCSGFRYASLCTCPFWRGAGDTSGSMERSLLATALGEIASYSVARDVPAARVVLLYGREHVFLIPHGAKLPFVPKGKVFRMR
ncbi:MAG: hypothetical protein FWE27_00535 [Defluviitaleaceae bacterium]|nr:hypothetical protein [Defluviitaleaceae bacterium]